MGERDVGKFGAARVHAPVGGRVDDGSTAGADLREGAAEGTADEAGDVALVVGVRDAGVLCDCWLRSQAVDTEHTVW
jgi:hypothetical protein